MNNANDSKPTPEQQGVMENLLDGLNAQLDLLSTKELKDELNDRGINAEEFLNRTSKIIKDAKQEHIESHKDQGHLSNLFQMYYTGSEAFKHVPYDHIKYLVEAFDYAFSIQQKRIDIMDDHFKKIYESHKIVVNEFEKKISKLENKL